MQGSIPASNMLGFAKYGFEPHLQKCGIATIMEWKKKRERGVYYGKDIIVFGGKGGNHA